LEAAIVASAETIAAAARSVVEGRPPIPRRAPNPRSTAAAVAAPGGDGRSAPALAAKRDEKAPPRPATSAPAATTPGVPLVMPNMDLIITEATVVAWLKRPGDPVHKGEAVAEIETDKAVTQVESPADGVLAEILVSEGTTVPLGQQLGTIRTD
jgi:2-oxoisovalerate dehydrogenase E1 component